MIELRPYQQEAVDRIRQAMARHRSVLFVLPTGGGKTVVFSHIAHQAASKGNRIAVLVHRVELLDQASRSLAAMGVRHGLIAPGRSMDLSAPVQVCSVQTLARRLHKLPPDLFRLLVVDEAHHSNAGTWARVLGHFRAARVLGVTATPCRTDGRGLGEWYGAMVLGPSPEWLTANGFLAPARVFAPPGVSLQGLHRRMGDYDMREAEQLLGAGQAMGDCLSHYRQHLSGRTAIAFCCSVAHAEAVARLFTDHGVASASIDGTMDTATRRDLLERLGTGAIKVLTSCALIGEGVDVPSVGGCILLRPTQSAALHLQMIGRCLRPQDGKVAVVLDHVGNVNRLGHHLDPRDWTLEGITKRDRERAPSVKVCVQCFCAMPSGKAECPECGHRFAPETRELEHVEGDLVEMLKTNFDIHNYKKLILEFVALKYENTKQGTKISQFPLLKKYGRFWPEKLCSELVADGLLIAAKGNDKSLDPEYMPANSDTAKRREQAQAETLADLVAIGKRRGMKSPHGWARHVMAAREAKGQRVPA